MLMSFESLPNLTHNIITINEYPPPHPSRAPKFPTHHGSRNNSPLTNIKHNQLKNNKQKKEKQLTCAMKKKARSGALSQQTEYRGIYI